MVSVSIKELLEAGIHFGHQTSRWNPKMKPYIFGNRDGIHIIDLQQTASLFSKALAFLTEVTSKGAKVAFVGTKEQARDIVREEATRAGMFYITTRWLGGTLTNFKTIKMSIDRLIELETKQKDGTFARLHKKERLVIDREIEKLNKTLSGIRGIKRPPDVLFVIDTKKEKIAVLEANKLGIPVVGIVDSNCDPDPITYPIPGNDDAIKAIKVVVSKVADACLEGARVYASIEAQVAKEKAAEEKEAKETKDKRFVMKKKVVTPVGKGQRRETFAKKETGKQHSTEEGKKELPKVEPKETT